MEDDITGSELLDTVLAGTTSRGLSTARIWDKSVRLAKPAINAGPANKRTYKLSRGTVRNYFDYLKNHGITYSLNFLNKRFKKSKWTYPKDKTDPNNLKILG